jgi:GT2 family glycosyltransferase
MDVEAVASARPGGAIGTTWLRLGREVVLVVLRERSAGPLGAEFRLDGGPGLRPLSQVAIAEGASPVVLVLLRAAHGVHLEMRRDGHDWVALGAAAGTEALAAAAAAAPRLLGLLAAKAAGPLRAAADPGLAHDLTAAARRLAQPAPEGMRPVALLGAGRQLWRLDAGGWLLSAQGLLRVPEPEAGLSPLPPVAGPALLLRAEAPPLLLPAATRAPTLVEIARQGGAAQQGLLRQAFLALRRHTAEPWCRDAIRDAQVLAMAPPRAAAEPANAVAGSLDRALSDGGGGVYCFGWLHDPLRLLRGLTLRGPFGAVPVPMERVFRITRNDVVKRFEGAPFGPSDPRPGFVVHIPDAGPGPVAQWKLELSLGSGDAIELVAGPALIPPVQAREAVLRSVNPLDVAPRILDECIAPAAARLHAAAQLEPVGQEIVQIGARPAAPPVSLVIPLYRNLRFVRHQIAAFARDPLLRQCEIVYVLDSPEQRGEAEHMLRGYCGLTELGVTLVLHDRNAGYATACNSGAAAAGAPVLLMLNSDVVPDRPGWLQPMLTHLAADPRISCVGPKLMFDDGSLQHAGLYFARGPAGDWFNCHYYKGFPRRFPDADRTRRVPGVTGAAMVIRRTAWDEVGGFNSGYIVGDYEDSDLCLRLREAGGDILYEPRAELFHFERQSIAQHGGYAGTVAAAYNRRLHHRRWDARIEALMAEFPRLGETHAAA